MNVFNSFLLYANSAIANVLTAIKNFKAATLVIYTIFVLTLSACHNFDDRFDDKADQSMDSSGSQLVQASLIQCPAQRPEVCTMDYRPVCARDESGAKKEFGNACGACAQSEIVAYEEGSCL